MITGLVLSNLLYPVVAVGVAIILALVVVIRYRRPRSVEANMKMFHRGMRALAPDNGAAEQHEPAPIRVTPQRHGASDGDVNGFGKATPEAPEATDATAARRPASGEAEAG